MSVLKWRLQQLSGKTRDRDRAAKADRDDIELITDEANNAAAAAADKQSSRRDSAATAAATARDKRRLAAGMGMREKLGLSQVQRGREIRRVELRRKKGRKHSDDEEKDEPHTAAAQPAIAAAAASDDSAAADGELQTTRGRRDEESKQQLDADRDTAGGGGGGGGDFISALHHTHSHDSKAEGHDEAEEERRKRRDKHESQSLRVALDAHGAGSAERAGKRSGHSSSVRPLTLSQQLQRIQGASDGPTNGRHTSLAQPAATSSAATSRPHTPPRPPSTLVALPPTTAAPSAAQSVDELSYSLSSPPSPSLPFLPALSHSLTFFRSSSLSRRWPHFHSLCLSPPCVSLLRSLYFLTFVDNFQNDGQPMREPLLVDINTHFWRLVQLLDITLALPHSAYTASDGALYVHLLTVLPEEVIVSSATASSARPANEAVKARLLTALPLLLSSAVFSLLYSLFPLSHHLLTLSFLHRLDCCLVSLTCGFEMADSTVSRQRAAYFDERPIELFDLSSLVPSHISRSRRATAGRDGQAAAAGQSSSAVTVDGSGRGGSSLFSRGDWARDEKERREQLERRKALTSAHSSAPSALSADFIRSDPTLSPYQRVLLLELLAPPSGSRQQLLNANSLSPLLAVGLQRCTPDSSWRLEHKMRYVVPAHAQSPHGPQHGSEYGGGSDSRAVRAVGIEEEAERWVRKMRGEGGRRSRHRAGKASAEHDEAGTAAGRASASTAAAQSSAASASSSSGPRDKLVEGDPLTVLTPRTRKLVLRYSAKDDEDDPQAAQHSKDGSKAAQGPASPALLSSNAKGTVGALTAEDVLTLDLAAANAGNAAKSARSEPEHDTAHVGQYNSTPSPPPLQPTRAS